MRTQLLSAGGVAVLIVGVAALAAVTAPRLESSVNRAAVNDAEVAILTNKERKQKDIPVLQRNALLDEAATLKAKDMAAKSYYAHVSPDGVTPMYWVEKVGYKYRIIGENLVVNRTDAEQVVDAFMGSPGHRANILRSDFTEVGIGVANGTYKGKNATFIVQIFAAPYPQRTAAGGVKPESAPVETVVASVPQKLALPATTTITRPSEALEKEVSRLISPIVSSIQNASTSTSTIATSTSIERPSFTLSISAPIELEGVSRLEAQTLPVPVGSGWTMEIRIFVDSLFKKAKAFLR